MDGNRLLALSENSSIRVFRMKVGPDQFTWFLWLACLYSLSLFSSPFRLPSLLPSPPHVLSLTPHHTDTVHQQLGVCQQERTTRRGQGDSCCMAGLSSDGHHSSLQGGLERGHGVPAVQSTAEDVARQRLHCHHKQGKGTVIVNKCV